MDIRYQVINTDDKRYRHIINRSSNPTKEEEVFELLDTDLGRVTYRDHRLVIYDYNNKAITLSLFLPKMVRDPKSKQKIDDGMKKFIAGKSKSSSKFVIRVRYFTSNWIFLSFTGDIGKRRVDFLINQYRMLKSKKMMTFPMKLGSRREYKELKYNLEVSYEKIRCTYARPRVFGSEALPYMSYYAWMKYEKPGRKKKIPRKVAVQRRKSGDFFLDEIKFEGYLVQLGYDPVANLTVKSVTPKRSKINSGSNKGGANFVFGGLASKQNMEPIDESKYSHNIFEAQDNSSRRINNTYKEDGKTIIHI